MHGITAGFKINIDETRGVQSAVGLDGVGGGPVLESVLVFDDGIEDL